MTHSYRSIDDISGGLKNNSIKTSCHQTILTFPTSPNAGLVKRRSITAQNIAFQTKQKRFARNKPIPGKFSNAINESAILAPRHPQTTRT